MCVDQLHDNELKADFKSCYGYPVLQTELKSLEKSSAMAFTHDIFFLYHATWVKSITMKILEVKETVVEKIYIVGKYYKPRLT